MAKCAYCGSNIIFGGKQQGDLRFCNDKCLQNGVLLSVLEEIPQDLLEKQIKAVHEGTCPKCHGRGPVDVHTSYIVWSALILTSWNSKPQICCRSCGIKSKVGSAFVSLLFGWWGFPWGLIMAPVQIVRNVAGIFIAPDPTAPSPALHKMVGLNIAARVVRQAQAERAGRQER